MFKLMIIFIIFSIFLANNYISSKKIVKNDLCSNNEILFFNCKLEEKRQIISLCLKKNDNKNYLVYRFGTLNKILHSYPKKFNSVKKDFISFEWACIRGVGHGVKFYYKEKKNNKYYITYITDFIVGKELSATEQKYGMKQPSIYLQKKELNINNNDNNVIERNMCKEASIQFQKNKITFSNQKLLFDGLYIDNIIHTGQIFTLE